ncbi:MAG: hypothetical protein B7Z63_05455 [Ignavibacteriae bacterium 37-53-5]|nr:MAG: hypothetical protein B7Z63_05455 [Ignavibacteriae bacterium 37-53-5]
MQYLGEFYSDNFQNPSKGTPDPQRTVNAHTVVNAWLTYRFAFAPAVRSVELTLQVNNLMNKIYVSNGEGDEFYPAAERNFFATLKLSL